MNQDPSQLETSPIGLRFKPARRVKRAGASFGSAPWIAPFARGLSVNQSYEPLHLPANQTCGTAPGASAVKVAHIVLALNTGGLERMVLRLLKATDRARFAPTVCALDEAGELAGELADLGVPLVVFGRKPGFDLHLAMRISRWMEREGFELVHTHNAAPHLYGSLAATLVRLRTGRGPRVVHTKHGDGALTSRFQPWLNHVSSRLSDRVVTVSAHMNELALTSDRVAPEKVLTVVNGVDLHEFAPGGDRSAARARLGVPQDGIHIGCVARLAPVKNHRTLIDAFALLKAQRPDVHLTLVGHGPTREALAWQIERLGLSEAITFAGNRLDIAEILPAFDVFALSSLTEGISLTLLEAAAAGLPIVATRVGGNAEIIEDQKSGLLVPPRDPGALFAALYQVVSMPDRARMGSHGRQRALERFSLDSMTGSYQSLYTELLAR